MPTYLSPGVYIEEVPAGTRPIEGVGTAIAGFVGFAPTGPVNEPTLVTNWIQYTSIFGDMVEEFALGKSVYGFFNNGGGRAYIVRLPLPGDGTTASPGLPVAQLALAGGGKGGAHPPSRYVPSTRTSAISPSTSNPLPEPHLTQAATT